MVFFGLLIVTLATGVDIFALMEVVLGLVTYTNIILLQSLPLSV
jgi:hypothetical protein